jgi:hypothetical protein
MIDLNKPSVLTIDGFWFVRSRYSIVLKNNPECTFMGNYERDKATLWQKLTMDLCAEVRNLGNIIDDITIVTDYNSWRKSHVYLTAPWSKLSDDIDSYKSNRTYDTAIDWNAMYKAFDAWCVALEQHFKIAYIKSYGAEGDDLMHVIKTIYNKAGKNVILFSTDGDSIQNCDVTESGAFTIQYKKQPGNKHNNFQVTNKLICINAFAEAINSTTAVNIFDFEPGNVSIQDAMIAHFHNVETHSIPTFLFYKCIMGDGGDNVMPVMQRFTAKKQFSPKINHIEAVLEKHAMSYKDLTLDHLYDVPFIKSFVNTLHSEFMKMLTLPDNYAEYYVNKFIENRHLMYLSDKEIPMNVMESIRTSISAKIEFIKIKSTLNQVATYKDALQIMGITVESHASNDAFSNFKS